MKILERVGLVLFLLALPIIVAGIIYGINYFYSLKSYAGYLGLIATIVTTLIGYICIFFMHETKKFKVICGILYVPYMAYILFALGLVFGMSIGNVYP